MPAGSTKYTLLFQTWGLFAKAGGRKESRAPNLQVIFEAGISDAPKFDGFSTSVATRSRRVASRSVTKSEQEPAMHLWALDHSPRPV
jgi:hypothetical protein